MKWFIVLILLFITGGLVNTGENILAVNLGTKGVDVAVVSVLSGFALGLYHWGETGVEAWYAFSQAGTMYSLAIVGLVILIYGLALRLFYKTSCYIRGLIRKEPQVSPEREKLGAFIVALMLLVIFTLGFGMAGALL